MPTNPHIDRAPAPVRVYAIVADAMLTIAKLCDATTRVSDVRTLFADDHVHAALIVDHGVLHAVIERADLADLSESDADRLAVDTGTLERRVVSPDAPLELVRLWMVAYQRRRLAVMDSEGRYLGLLCLKRTGLGFCSNEDVSRRYAGGQSLRPGHAGYVIPRYLSHDADE